MLCIFQRQLLSHNFLRHPIEKKMMICPVHTKILPRISIQPLYKIQPYIPPLAWTFLSVCLSFIQQSVCSFFLNLFTILLLSHAIRNDSSLWYPQMIINKPFPLILLFICPSFWSLVSTHHIWPFEHHIRFTAKASPQACCLTSCPL